jgi:Sulfotransferase domain
MKVIGAGFGRTGTMSLKAALCQLGFGPCHHMSDATEDPELEDKWLQKARGRNISWAEILDGYESIVDWPGCYFWEELTSAFPGAKVILTVRDPDAWYASAAETIYAQTQELAADEVRMPNLVIWRGTFDGRFADKNHAISVLEEHNRRVISAIPRERLLVYEIRAGWAPLCEFLGVAVPAGARFPHVNDRAQFQASWLQQAP